MGSGDARAAAGSCPAHHESLRALGPPLHLSRCEPGGHRAAWGREGPGFSAAPSRLWPTALSLLSQHQRLLPKGGKGLSVGPWACLLGAATSVRPCTFAGKGTAVGLAASRAGEHRGLDWPPTASQGRILGEVWQPDQIGLRGQPQGPQWRRGSSVYR